MCKNFLSPELKQRITQAQQSSLEKMQSTFPRELAGWDYFERAQYIEAKSLMAGYLLSSQGDRMLMKNSVEGRFPYLDHRVIEFANRIHPRLKMKVLNEKFLLKKIAKKYIPASILERKKQPYRAPDMAALFAGSVAQREMVRSLLSPDSIQKNGYFDAQKIGFLLKKVERDQERGATTSFKDSSALVAALSTQAWHQIFVENFKSPPITPTREITHAI